MRATYVAGTVLAISLCGWAQDFRPDIPRVWDDQAVAGLELPLAQRDRSPRYMSSEEYYKLKVRPIYRSYPAYAKGQEPPGYLESLTQKEPEIIFDASKFRTKEDWIEAGRLVFDADTKYFPAREQPAAADVPWPVRKDAVLPGFVPGYRYFIRKRGVLEGGINSCSGCHTRLMTDGSYFEGAQGSVDRPVSAVQVLRAREAVPETISRRLNNY